MKIRIYNDTLRLRLDRSEVELVAASQTVVGTTHFAGGAVFEYRLGVADIGAVSARFEAGTIHVILPEATAQAWATTDAEVSISAVDGTLSLLIEKDFECLDPREGEDQSNRFRNPKAAALD